MSRMRVEVQGAVQGVGFRPFVYRLARELNLGGFVLNSPQGVLVEAEGPPEQLDQLLERLRAELPPHASIESLRTAPLPDQGEQQFRVEASRQEGPATALVLPDLAMCPACLRDIYDPSNRRYRYPFTNCTYCGPRYSILHELPYDRARTTMARFPMCARCLAEYRDPGDRRFHAQPNACPECGPQVALWDRKGRILGEHDAAMLLAQQALKAGAVVAVKGLGGFHLMVDARDTGAIRRLRTRKHRPDKPLAVMAPNWRWVEDHCLPTDLEKSLMTSRQAPIVLVEARHGRVNEHLSPGLRRIGVMLPYTPLHQLLLGDLGFPVVATSGNRVEEPLEIDERDALEHLGGIADLFLVHNRPIARPVDDSVVQVCAGHPQLIRRARGYAPLPVRAPLELGARVGVGGHQKATLAWTQGSSVFLSQHLGDLDTEASRVNYARVARDLPALLELSPAEVRCDLHPDYFSTRWAEECGLPLKGVQHHLAHVRSALLDAGWTGTVLGVSWDGTGFGPDHTVWGGEFFLGDRRVAHLRTFVLPGGEAAVREPRRCALGLIWALGKRVPLPFSASELRVLSQAQGVNCPRTSSAGRLFDGVAALCGLHREVSYEGQAAAELEALARGTGEYPIRYAEGVLDWGPAVEALLAERAAGVPLPRIAFRFHAALAEGICQVAEAFGESRVVLTGGCFQNVLLTELAVEKLRRRGFEPFWHRQIPPNDGGLAAGQVM